MKRPLPTIYDPNEGMQHIAAPPYADQVTLCGETDWIGREQGKEDRPGPVDCNLCKWIFDFCNSGTWPKSRAEKEPNK